jgi:hypothetical protein
MKDVKLVLSEQEGFGQIYMCGCNSVHMNVGPVTVKLSPKAFAQMAILVRKAMEGLDQITSLIDGDGARVLSNEHEHNRFTH